MDQRNASSKRKCVNRFSALATCSLVAAGALALSNPSDAGRRSSHRGPVAISQSDVFLFGTTTQLEGASSQLVRTDAGVTATFETHSLEAGAVHTLWWVVFNEPENCEAGTVGSCGLGDLMNDLAVPSLLWGAGNVAEDSGTGGFGAHLRVGNPPGEVRFGPGLLDPWGAEIHVVVRSHGAPIPGQVHEQLTAFIGGCDVNICANLQFAVHEN
jgi:hypothetical protein